MQLSKLKKYIPDEYFNGEGIQYFIDENGHDWYQSLPKFKKKYAIAFDENGIIRFYGENPARFYPGGLSVTDLDALPEGINVLGDWVFDGKKVTRRVLTTEEQRKNAEAQRAQRIENAIRSVASIQLRLLGGRPLTDEETARLNATLDYIADVESTSITGAPDIRWPPVPDGVGD